MTQEEAQFIWHLMPTRVKEHPKGLTPMDYGTLSRGGDIEVYKRVKKILNLNTKGK